MQQYIKIHKLLKKAKYLCLSIVGVAISWMIICTNSTVGAVSLSANSSVTVVATYYGGEFNNNWIIDNVNQCSRISNGEFSAESLGAVVDSVCDDDNGLGYLNDIPLHNTVSFAELSVNASNRDYSALGNLPVGTRLEIEYKGKCLVAEKRDVGTGGYGMNGYPRAIDLWWQTARSLGFTNGFDTVNVRLAGSSPLTPLGQNSVCSSASTNTTPPPQQTNTAPTKQKNNQTLKSKEKTNVSVQTPPTVPVASQESIEASEPGTKSASVTKYTPENIGNTASSNSSKTNYIKFFIPILVGMFLTSALMTNKITKLRKKLIKSTK